MQEHPRRARRHTRTHTRMHTCTHAHMQAGPQPRALPLPLDCAPCSDCAYSATATCAALPPPLCCVPAGASHARMHACCMHTYTRTHAPAGCRAGSPQSAAGRCPFLPCGPPPSHGARACVGSGVGAQSLFYHALHACMGGRGGSKAPSRCACLQRGRRRRTDHPSSDRHYQRPIALPAVQGKVWRRQSSQLWATATRASGAGAPPPPKQASQ